MQALPYVFAAVSAVSSISAGNQKADALQQQAQLDEAQAKRAQVQGIEDANTIKKDLLARLAANNARTGSAGIQLTGSPQAVSDSLQADAERQLSVARANAVTSQEAAIIAGQEARTNASAARIQGVGGAFKSLLPVLGSPSPGTPTTGKKS